MTDHPRLIENAFPLKEASLDSVHEKNVRHGHISTLHIWPARRPLAACRAALIATLLPDPGTPEARKALCERIAGKVVKRIEKKKMPNGSTVEREKLETEGGILHWGREAENAETMEWFRNEIRKAYGGRAPKVLDPFSGGGAIPLEAMRLGCEATAVDINPVAWFILKCTLEYPQSFAGQKSPLPVFILRDEEFMAEFFQKAKGMTKGQAAKAMERLGRKVRDGEQGNLDFGAAPDELEADLAWHVRAWGRWVLDRARRDLAKYYPTYADFEPLKESTKAYEREPTKLVPVNKEGIANTNALNRDFSADYLSDKRNPRWVAKPTVAYLWARSVECKNCRAAIPLLKTRWLCKTDRKRVLLTVEPSSDGAGVSFGVHENVQIKGGNSAQKREHDKMLGIGTLSQSGGRCVYCKAIMTLPDIQVAAKANEWGTTLCAVIVDGQFGKEYRAPTAYERATLAESLPPHPLLAADPLDEPIDPTRPSPNARGLSGLTRYGITTFGHVFSPRQQTALAILCAEVAQARVECETSPIGRAASDVLALAIGHVANRNSTLCHWDIGRETISSTFQRYALRVNWDFVEGNPAADGSGSFAGATEWIAMAVEHASNAFAHSPTPNIVLGSATRLKESGVSKVDLVLTDPPYYDAIPYADLSDFFYVWLRRTLGRQYAESFRNKMTDKSEELIQHAARTGGDNVAAKQRYEDGMAAAFGSARERLVDNGRMVVVFAHKQPDAWETLASSIIRAGFTVDASWPIQTEMPNKAAGGARLASSVWMVCKIRPESAGIGWDNRVIEEMRRNIGARLQVYWDAGIRGPDFIWAATGPALEAYSKHPVIRKANGPGTMTVNEFLGHVRRLVVDYVVGQVLTGHDNGVGREASASSAERLDEPTAYYLLHRNDFGLADTPVGTVILYAVSVGLSDRELSDTWDLIVKSRDDAPAGEDPEDETSDDSSDDGDQGAGTGSTVKLRSWAERKGQSIGYEAPGGRGVPLIDRIHRLMHLYKAGDTTKVDEYLDEHGLRRQDLFKRVIQSLIELSRKEGRGNRGGEGDETTLLEAISNHIGTKGAKRQSGQRELGDESGSWSAATSAGAE